MGELVPAVAFMDEAAKRAPTNSNYRSLALRLLWDSGRYQEAYSRARAYLTDPSTPARLVLMSGGIVAQRATQSPEPADLNSVAKLAVSRMQQALRDTSTNLAFSGQIALGLLAVQVNDINVATNAFHDALEVKTASDEQVTSSFALSKELELVRSGKAKTPEERSNARRLAGLIQPSRITVPA